MSWKKVKLGDCCEITSSKRIFYSEYTDHGIPFYRSKEIIERSQCQSISESLYIANQKYNEIKNKFGVPVAGDMLLTSVGTIGIPYIVKESDEFYFKDGNLTWFKNFTDKLCVQYLYYWVSSKEGTGVLNNTTIGGSEKAVTISALKNIEITVPPIEAQRRIADILSAYDDLVENNHKQIKLLEEAAQRLYKEWFVDLHFPGYEHTKIVDGVPEGWKKERLINIADVQYGYAFDGSQFNSKKLGTPIIRIRNIPESQTEDYTTEVADPQYMVYNGDIVVGMDGEFHINSWAGDTAYLVQRTCRIKPLNADLNGFLLWAIHGPIKYFEKTVVGATVAHLGKKHIDTIQILVPSEKFYLPFKTIFDKRLLLMNENKKLKEAREHLLPKLMNGEVKV